MMRSRLQSIALSHHSLINRAAVYDFGRVRFPSSGFKTFLSRGTKPKCHEVNTRLDRPCRVTLVKTCDRLSPPVTPMMSSSLRIPIYRDAITCNLAHLRHVEIKITIHCSLSSFLINRAAVYDFG